MPATSKAAAPSSATIGFEAKLWLAADKLRNHRNAAEPERSEDSQPQTAHRASAARQYKQVVPGLIFLSRAERDRSRGRATRRARRGLRVKYISDTFEEHRPKLLAGQSDYAIANPEDPDEPSEARQPASASPQGEREGVHQCGVPPKGNANFAWLPHFIQPLAPQGMAGVDFVCLRFAPAVLANGSMSSNQSGEGDIRQKLIEADLVDCMVALPGQLFYSTQIPVCLWFIARDKSRGQPSPRPSPTGRGRSAAEGEGRLRDRRKQTLFIDARKLGTLIDRVHRELTDADLEKSTSTYHEWRADPQIVNHKSPILNYADAPGFCKSATTAEVAAHGHVLTPGRYVGAEEVADDGDPFEEKMPRLVAERHAQFAESAKLEAAIRANLKSLNFTP